MATLVGIARLAAESPRIEAKSRVDYFDLPARSFLTKADSSRVPFRWQINPYRGCEFGCKYCYARYAHEFMELRDPLDFERRIFVKQFSASAFRGKGTPARRCPRGGAIALGTATGLSPAGRAQCLALEQSAQFLLPAPRRKIVSHPSLGGCNSADMGVTGANSATSMDDLPAGWKPASCPDREAARGGARPAASALRRPRYRPGSDETGGSRGFRSAGRSTQSIPGLRIRMQCCYARYAQQIRSGLRDPLDFEQRIFAKQFSASALQKELAPIAPGRGNCARDSH